jgi:WD40 repeat protein/tetratricopeptide (TPR) repeat protein
MNTVPSIERTEIRPFKSLTRMREAHTKLIKRHRESGSSQGFIDDAIEFVRRARATGSIIDQDADRCTAQGLLDYWLTIIYRSGQEFSDWEATLQDFDVWRQPELKSSDCPYVGLETFSEAKAEFFFGRQNLVKQWISKLAKHRLVAVVGPFGSGKASLISAGVVPALRSGAAPGSEHWRYFPIIRPGSDPLRNVIDALGGAAIGSVDEIAEAMRNSSTVLLGLVERGSTQPGLLIFLRFEEVFTLAREEDRKALADNLLELVKAPVGHRVLVALRNEFITHLVQLGPQFQEELLQGEVFVPPFDASELREVVERPAARVGLKFDEGLVEALIYDVLGDPAALALLQFTLLKLWDQRERNRITWNAYREISGGRLAFERMAEEMYSKLGASEQEILKAVLLRIVRPGTTREVIIASTVRRASLYESAASHNEVDLAISALLGAGLVRILGDEADSQRIGVVNEGLITKWPRLIEWLEDERTRMRRRQRLTIAAAQWKEKNEDAGALWGGLSLEEVRTYHDLNDLEQEFIDASFVASARRKRLRRWLIFAAASSLAVILILVWANLWQHYKLQNEKLRMADVERGMRLLEAGDPSGGAVWFAEVFNLKPPEPIRTDVCRRRLEIGLRLLPRLLQLLPHDREASYAEMSSDGRHIVTLTTRGEQSAKPSDSQWATGAETAWLWTIKDHEAAHPIPLVSGLPANGVCISPDGKLVATIHGACGKGNGEVRIWNITGDEPNCIRQLGCQSAVTIAAWSPDSTHLAFAQETGTTSSGQTLVWDWRNETKPGKLLTCDFKIRHVMWGPRGNLIATAGGDLQTGEVRLWNPADDKDILQSNQSRSLKPDTAINDLVFSADGELLLTADGIPGGNVGTAQIWKTKTGERVGLLPHKGAVLTARFSPDNKLVVTASADGTARVWSATSGREMLSLPHNAWVYCATFSPDGRYIATGSRDRMARVWDLLSGQLAIPPMNHGGTVSSIAFSSDGRRLITTSKEIARVWDFATGITPAPALNTDGEVMGAAFSRDGKRVVTVTQVNSGKSWKADVWEAASGRLLSSYEHNVPITRAVLSDEGSRLALTASDVENRFDEMLVIDASSGKVLSNPIRLDGAAAFIGFGHVGARHVITLTSDDKGTAKVARVWDTETGQPLTEPLSHPMPLSFATLSPDDTLLLTTGGGHDLPKEGKACIWRVTQGEQRPITLTHEEVITRGAFSGDGQQVITASEDNCARVWRTLDGHSLSGLLKNLHTADLSDASFSPDGNRILTASYDGTAVVCDWRNAKIVSIFRHAGIVNRAQFSPDGRRVVTASSDCTARLWDVQTNELIGILNHSWPVQEASFSSDGNSVFALSGNGASGQVGFFQRGAPAASLPDEPAPSRRTIQAQTWNISVDRKHSDTELGEIAELLSVQSHGENEQLGILPAEKLVSTWRRLRASYLSDFADESQIAFHSRSADASEAAKQWFAATWHLTRLLETNDADSNLRQRRAKAYSQLLKWDDAIADYNVALKSRPEDDTLLNQRAQAFTETQKWDAAASDCEAVIAHNPKAARARLTLALVRCQQDRADDAVEQLRKIMEFDPDNLAAWQRLALVELQRGQLDRYRAVCAAILERFKDKPKLGSIIGWPCVLAPRSLEDISPIVELARKAVESSPASYYRMNTFGAALYRAGKYREAADALDRSRKLYASSVAARIAESRDDSLQPQLSESSQGRAIDWVFLAMSYFQRGDNLWDKRRAEWLLDKVKQNLEDGAPAGTEIAAERRLWNRIELEILYKEAKSLIAPSASVP